jgi:glucose-6-phosphate isomerase
MGPHAVYHALQAVKEPIRLHFLSAVDGTLVDRTLGALDPDTTLVIVSSKSFSTRETMVNAAAVDEWLGEAGLDAAADRAKHVILVTAKPEAYREMNVPITNQFPLWDWVGGRFSVWGAIGLPDVIALGPDVFKEMLAGAAEMDRHMLETPVERNLPAILALLSTWCSSHWNMQYHCLLPYDERLRHMVPWLQQLEMESLGKTYSPTGERVEGMTGQGVWGGHGNEAQHSFYQWLREGTGRTSIDLLWCDNPGHSYHHHHRVLVANAKAQAKALVTREMPSDGFFNAVTTIRLDELTPRRLGALMAMYEHKTTMLAHLFGINAFDQPGVELGKRLSHQVESQF